MTPEEIKELKDGYLDHLKEYITQTGSLFAHLVVIGTTKEDNKKSIIHIPVPDEFIQDEKGKELFIKKLVPEAAKEIVKKFNYEVIGWASEAWIRTIDQKDSNNLKNWKDIPIKKEVVFIIFESKDGQETIVYDIIRNGKQVNTEGELADSVDLVEDKELSTMYKDSKVTVGRLTGLYKTFEDASKADETPTEKPEADLSV